LCNSDKKIIAIGEMVNDKNEKEENEKGEACFVLTWKGD